MLRLSTSSLFVRGGARFFSSGVASRGAVAVTPTSLRASADRMVDYYLERQLPNGGLEGCDDPCHYCKLPNALVWGGKIKEADAMLDFCVDKFMRPNGDFTLSPSDNHFAPLDKKTLHWEFYDFYAYLNQWWMTAGIRLSRFDFVPQAYNYVESNWYNPKANAGILQAPLDGNYENCIFTSAHLGFSMMHCGQNEKANLVADTIVKMVGKQPDMDNDTLTYYNRFDDDHQLIKSWDADDKGVKLAAIVDGKEETQCWWSLGYPIAFMAHMHNMTGKPEYLQTAETILEFVGRCHPNSRNSIIAHKVMWGASLVGNITGKKEHWDIVRSVSGHIMDVGQVEDGRVLNWGWEKDANGVGTEYGEAQVIDQTCEIAYWFYVVACQLEKAERNGKLA